MKNFKLVLVIFLLAITAFSVFKYAVSLKEKYDLLNTINQIKTQVTTLENEKQNLLQLKEQLVQENSGLKDNLRASEEKIAKQAADFTLVQNALENLSSQISLVKAENDALREERDNLSGQLTQVSQEKEGLKARLGSLAELKKAIKELKKQMRRLNTEVKKKAAIQKIIEGNRGYLVKDGRPTYPSKIRIEVNPPLPKE